MNVKIVLIFSIVVNLILLSNIISVNSDTSSILETKIHNLTKENIKLQKIRADLIQDQNRLLDKIKNNETLVHTKTDKEIRGHDVENYSQLPNGNVNKIDSYEDNLSVASIKESAETTRREFEDKFLYETVDSQWNNEVTKQFNAKFEKLRKFGTDIVSLECKTSLCKMRINHKNGDALDYFNLKFSSVFDWKGDYTAVTTSNDNGQLVTILHLNREAIIN